MKLCYLILLFLCLLTGCQFNPNLGNNKVDNPTTSIETEQKTDDVELGETTLSILSMNDVHGYIMQDAYGRYGISNVSYVIESIREEKGEENVVLIANGDMFQGTGLVRMSYGQVMIDVMNQMNFDACCIGNHEFDWDLPVILNYFDGDEENGEADFPLLNANIYRDGVLVSDDNIFEYHMVEKGDINVGLIGYIGDVKGSINALYADAYDFDVNYSESVARIGALLKDNGADVIIVSIHDASTRGVNYFQPNQQLAMLKYNGEYLVDAVINGHTHTEQSGAISRAGGVAMPVIQSSPYRNGYFYEFGEIELKIDNETNDVIGFNVEQHKASEAGKNFDSKVENIIDSYYDRDKDVLAAKYCNNKEYASRYDSNVQKWVANVMVAATGADIAICNTGGLRANLPEGVLTFEDIYQMNPFDNEIIVHEVSCELINEFIQQEEYYFYSTASGSLKTTGTYKVAIIDYVYYGYYYQNLRTDSYLDTNLILRDLLIKDLSLREEINFEIVNKSVLEK